MSTVSNINVKSGGYFSDTVCIYDSARPQKISPAFRKLICSFFKSTSDTLRFDIMNVQGQTNSHDCGVHAIATATELTFNCDPVACKWNEGEMRQHLTQCLENDCITRFPTHATRRIRMGMRMLNSLVENVFCVCKMPNDIHKSMVKCDTCLKWFHGECMSISCDDVRDSNWNCPKCTKDCF